MTPIDLTRSQRAILSALLECVREQDSGEAVKGERIADVLDRTPGTIRNQMQGLKALQLVEGVPGPKGGYQPTAKAYRALGVATMDEAERVPIHNDGEPVADVTVTDLHLVSVHDPQRCRAEVRTDRPCLALERGDPVRVGPTPVSNLVVEGELTGQNRAEDNVLLLQIEELSIGAD
jgi:predicted transcriptional regulator